MTERYPIFTDGKRYYHSSGKFPKNCRFAYWENMDIKEWEKKVMPKLKGAKEVYERWNKKK